MRDQVNVYSDRDDTVRDRTDREAVHVANTSSATKDRFKWVESDGSAMEIFLNVTVDSEVKIGWRLPQPDADSIVIIFGGHHEVSVEFFELESLELLRDVADDAAARLRAAIRAKARHTL